jgi:surface protein
VTVRGTASRLGRAATGNIISGTTLVSVTNFGAGVFNTTDFSGAFRNCINLTSVPASIPSAVTKCASMFRSCAAFNSANVALWNTTNITDMNVMLGSATAFNQNLAGWNVSNVTIMTSAFFGTSLSNTNYDAILASWSTQSVQPSVSVHFGTAKYTNVAARNILTSAPNNWSITDGGAL